MLTEELLTKWNAVLEHPELPKISDPHKRAVTALMLEQTEGALREGSSMGANQFLLEDPIPANFMGASSSTHGAGGIDTFDPILISLVRRAMPNLVAYDICGVQPMTGPVGLIFALRSRYTNQSGDEWGYNESNGAFSTVQDGANTIGHKFVGTLPGNSISSANLAANGLYNYAAAMSTAQAEALGTDSNTAFPQMAFTIEKMSVTAGSRALKAEYTMELAQDLKAVHGLDAEGELSRILSGAILTDINREIVRTINITASPGAQENTTTAGRFDLDVDANGRWMVEKFKGLHFQIERERNAIAKATRRGRGNLMICSSDVASALRMTGLLRDPPVARDDLTVDDTGNTFVGVLSDGVKVYIDPYSSGGQYMVIGYKGASSFDAGLFYCPYVPLQMVRAVDQESFHPKIGFKTRYGVVANPFAQGSTQGLGALVKDSNVYYRRVLVDNIM